MNPRLKTWTLCGALVMAAGSLQAAQERSPDGRGHRQSVETRVSRMREHLGLSDEQAGRIEAILNEAAAKPVPGANEDRMAQRQEVRRRINEVLTPEQREKRDKIAAERKGGGRRGERRRR